MVSIPPPDSPPSGVPRRLDLAAGISWRLLVVAAALALAGYVALELRLVVLPLLLALLLAAFLGPAVVWLKARGWRPAPAAFAVMVGAALLVAGPFAALAPSVVSELGDLDRTAEEGLQEVSRFLAEEPLGVTQREVERSVDRAVERLRENSGALAGGFFRGAALAAEVVGGALLAVVLLFFLLKDGGAMWRWVVGRFPEAARNDVDAGGRRALASFGGYMRGLVVVGLVDAVLIGLALVVLGVPLAAPLAVLTFFGAFLPLVGATLAGIVAVLVALVTKGLVTALIIGAVILLVQQVEGDVLYPVVMRRAVALHPVVVLAALTAGGVLLGVVGALLAVPLAAAVRAALLPAPDAPAAPPPG